MTDKRKPADTGRRNFLKMAATGAPAAAVAAVAGDKAEAVELETKSSGLRKTEHVKKYLDSARF